LLDEFGDRVTRRQAEWESRWWSPIINAEHLALRERAGFTDLTAFAIFDVTGPGALDVVQRVAMRQMDVPVGRTVYTPILLPAGGFRADLTIMRIDDDVFRVVTGGAWGMSDLKWFSDHLPEDGSVQIHDQTNAWTTLGLWGPRARDILSSVTSDDVSHDGFPFAWFKPIEVGPLQVIASRISYVGDLGWELYVPIEQGARLWDIIAEAGLPHGAVPVGAGVYGTTGRLEKCYRAYGAELEGEYNVVEAGMAWGRVKDQDFIGKEAHVRQRDEQQAAIMCALTVDDHTSSNGVKRYMMGGEPILTGNGEPITDAKGRRSYVTSAGSGPSIGKYILMSYLPPEHAVVGRSLQVQYMGERYPVTVATNDSTPVFDPDNDRVRS
jgi:glycine cleavage system aminomethyltransferase T